MGLELGLRVSVSFEVRGRGTISVRVTVRVTVGVRVAVWVMRVGEMHGAPFSPCTPCVLACRVPMYCLYELALGPLLYHNVTLVPPQIEP